ncbi:MAG: coproporphyrinogen III oxidase, partial [bacterium]
MAQWRAATGGRPSDGNQIYVHIPFCPFNCHFCPLFKVRSSRDKSAASREAYLRALVGEIELYGNVPEVASRSFNTVYFGGGTPTELDPSQLAR